MHCTNLYFTYLLTYKQFYVLMRVLLIVGSAVLGYCWFDLFRLHFVMLSRQCFDTVVGWQERHPACKILHSNSQQFFFERRMGTSPNLEWSPEKQPVKQNLVVIAVVVVVFGSGSSILALARHCYTNSPSCYDGVLKWLHITQYRHDTLLKVYIVCI